MFAAAASAQYDQPHLLLSFRAYNISGEDPNLTVEQETAKAETFHHYASCDKAISPCIGGVDCGATTCVPGSELYGPWYARQYYRSRDVPPMSGPISSIPSSGQCLVALGTGVVSAACSGGAEQTWNWAPDYTLKDPAGNCLTAPVLNASTTPTLTPCSGQSRQRWFVMDDGQIQLASPPQSGELGHYSRSRCLDMGEGTAITLRTCGETASQYWAL
jgi:hypothetical protein